MTSTGEKTRARLLAGLAILVLVIASACVVTDLASGKTVSLAVTLTESQLNELIQRTSNNQAVGSEKLLKEVTSVDLQPGLVRVFGKYERPDGTLADGSYDFKLDAEDGQLKAQVVAVNIGDMKVDDPQVTSLNREITTELSQAANEGHGEVTFDDVVITDTEMKISFSVKASTPTP